MSTSTYTIFTVNAEGEKSEAGTKSKKATAIEFARGLRDEQATNVSVETGNGTEVFALAAPKKIKMSPRYSRTVELPEGVTAPEGARVAYVRPRRNAAVLHFADAEKETQYALLDLKTGKVLKQRFRTTRDAGLRMNEGVGAGKVQAPEAEVAEPANA